MVADGSLVRVERVLAALARGVLGPAYDSGTPAHMMDVLVHGANEYDRRRLLKAVRMLDSRVGALALTGRATPVSWLSGRQAEALLQRWRSGRSGNARSLGQAVTDIALFCAYAYETGAWQRIGYPGPRGAAPEEPRRLDPVVVDSHRVLTCDVVVVGSGAGGACLASELAGRGFDVVVLEKGSYRSEADFDHLEAHASRDMYLYGKTLATTDLGVRIIAGRTVGGGTLVNYATAFRTPEHVLKQWAEISGIDAFVSGEFADSLDAVSARLNVNTDSSAAGKRDRIVEEGLKKLGWHVDNIPRAVRGCTQDEQCGYCGFGCRIGAKQSTMRTYLEDAQRDGARIVPNVDVRKIRIRNGRAVGVDALCGPYRVIVEARAVAVAGGAIETPALLLRSGLRGQVGHNLHLHPGSAAWGLFDEDVRAWEGTTQSRYSTEFRDWDDGYGPIFETVPVHPGEFASAVPWTSAREHLGLMGDYARIGFCAVLPRDTSTGRVRISRDGGPRVHYALTADDQRRIAEGIVRAGRVMEAAGAKRVNSPHRDTITYEPGVRGGHETWADSTRARGYGRGRVTFYSYHQMGSCRMGLDPTTSAIGPDNETHEVRDLFVTDASAFPTASGVNPMLTVYALAHRAASKIAGRHS